MQDDVPVSEMFIHEKSLLFSIAHVQVIQGSTLPRMRHLTLCKLACWRRVFAQDRWFALDFTIFGQLTTGNRYCCNWQDLATEFVYIQYASISVICTFQLWRRKFHVHPSKWNFNPPGHLRSLRSHALATETSSSTRQRGLYCWMVNTHEEGQPCIR